MFRKVLVIFLGPFRKLADGDLTGNFDAKGLGWHFGLFLRLLGDIHRNLGAIVTQVRHSSDAVAQSAREVTDGSTDLSRRTERQAATLEETAAGMEELATTVTQNAENCKVASELAQRAEAVARDGAQEVDAVAIESRSRSRAARQRVHGLEELRFGAGLQLGDLVAQHGHRRALRRLPQRLSELVARLQLLGDQLAAFRARMHELFGGGHRGSLEFAGRW